MMYTCYFIYEAKLSIITSFNSFSEINIFLNVINSWHFSLCSGVTRSSSGIDVGCIFNDSNYSDSGTAFPGSPHYG